MLFNTVHNLNSYYARISNMPLLKLRTILHLAPVVQKVDNAIHRINHYPADSVVCFVKTYPLDSDLSSG